MKTALPAILAAVALAAALGAVGISATTRAQTTTVDPMRAPNPMIPNPLLPNPLSPPTSQGGGDETEYERDPELGNLPISAGVEDVYYACTACHSEQTFVRQRLTDERWDYLWTWMIQEQGMFEYDEATRDVILAYLKRHFSSER